MAFREVGQSQVRAELARLDLPGYLAPNVEKSAYNHAVSYFRKQQASVNVRVAEGDFRRVYNVRLQQLMWSADTLRAFADGSLLPNELGGALDAREGAVVDEDDPEATGGPYGTRAALRWHFRRVFARFLGVEVARDVEAAIAREHPQAAAYRSQALRVVGGMRNSETGLVRRILDGETAHDDVARATHRELWPEFWERPENLPGHRIVILKENVENINSMLTCSRCKKNCVKYYEMQTRSADEPMTVFATCLVCNKRWKM